MLYLTKVHTCFLSVEKVYQTLVVLISVYNPLNLIWVLCFLVMTCDMISFKGYIILNTLWKRMERYNYNSITAFVEVDKGQAFVTGSLL